MSTLDAKPSPVLRDLVVITGFSGAGKSTAMDVFEDAGYFCVDNLPAEMIRPLVELFTHPGSKVAHVAVVSDVRSLDYFDGLIQILDELSATGVGYRLLFMDCDDETLLTRYKETRRRHPLSPDGSVSEGIARERELLAPLKARADVILDTAGMSVARFRRRLAEEMLPTPTPGRLAVTFESFGFKYGQARDSDLMFDVRFLPNPYYELSLRELTGEDSRIVDYINRDGSLDRFYDKLLPLLDYLLPQYLQEGKAHLVVAVGCTGGRHRSVAIAKHLTERFRPSRDYVVEEFHRDLQRGG
jgi:UPF0042 nucleotide-binding protein